MLVARLIDLPLGPEGRQDVDSDRERILASLDAVRSLVLEPDLYLVTGDIIDGPTRRATSSFFDGSVRIGKRRIVGVDTAMAEMDGGCCDAERGERLAAALEAESGVPAIVAMHPPPVSSGMAVATHFRDTEPRPAYEVVGAVAGIVSRFEDRIERTGTPRIDRKREGAILAWGFARTRQGTGHSIRRCRG